MWLGRVMKGKLVVKHYFVLPQNHHLPSGGNLYNSFLIRALKNKGVPLSTGSFDQILKVVRKNIRMRIWVDSLCLPRLPLLLGSTRSKQCIFLIVHHLPSFEPDLSHTRFKMRTDQEKKILSRINGFLVTSSYVKELLRERGFEKKIFVVVPPALCLNPHRKKERPKEFKGMMAANLIAQKGILDLLKSLEKEVRPGDDFIINIAGRDDIEPDYARACLEYIGSSSLLKESIHFLGFLKLKQMEELYATSSVFISASKMETYGMAVKEALAYGLPVLAYNGGYVRTHLQSGANGYLCSTFSELARKCVQFIRNPGELKSLSEQTEKSNRNRGYTWKKAAGMFIHKTSRLIEDS